MNDVVLGVLASLIAAPLLWASRLTWERLRARRRRPTPVTRGTATETPPEGAESYDDRSTCQEVRTTFVGRSKELGDIVDLLSHAPLVTLTGPGGSGKTRLALEVRAAAADHFPDGTRCVDLTALSNPGLVVPTIAYVVGVPETSSRDTADTLVAALRRRRMLLVLDNCEHLLDRIGQLVSRLVWQCPLLGVLATSREALNVPGERRFPVRPLEPPPADAESVSRALEHEAVKLFVERATAVQPEFSLTPDNVSAVVAVCRKLDGIPLAIELAAARLRAMHVGELADALDARLELVAGQPVGADARHRTLAHTMAWSFDRLSPTEQRLWAHISVFAGAFDRDAAVTLTSLLVREGSGAEVEDALDGLVDNSLVQLMPETPGPTTYRLLETVRRYGQSVADERGEWQPARATHARLFLARSDELEPKLTSGERTQVWGFLERIYPDFRAALGWSLEEKGDPVLGLRLAGNLFWYWNLAGRLSEGREWLDALMPKGERWADTPTRARALYAAGGLAFLQGDFPPARGQLEASVELWRQVDDPRGLGLALIILGMVKLFQDELAAAHADEEEAASLFVAIGHAWGEALAHNDLANVSLAQGDLAGSRELFERSISIWEKVGDPWGLSLSLGRLGCVAQQTRDFELATGVLTRAYEIRKGQGDLWGQAESLRDLGDLARCQGRHLEAMDRYEESLRLNVNLGRHQMVADCLVGLGAVAGATGDPLRAGELLGMADALRAASGVKLSGPALEDFERTVGEARGDVPSSEFTAAFERASQLTVEQVLDGVDSG